MSIFESEIFGSLSKSLLEKNGKILPSLRYLKINLKKTNKKTPINYESPATFAISKEDVCLGVPKFMIGSPYSTSPNYGVLLYNIKSLVIV